MKVYGIEARDIGSAEAMGISEAVKILRRRQDGLVGTTDFQWTAWCKLRNAANYLIELLAARGMK